MDVPPDRGRGSLIIMSTGLLLLFAPLGWWVTASPRSGRSSVHLTAAHATCPLIVMGALVAVIGYVGSTSRNNLLFPSVTMVSGVGVVASILIEIGRWHDLTIVSRLAYGQHCEQSDFRAA